LGTVIADLGAEEGEDFLIVGFHRGLCGLLADATPPGSTCNHKVVRSLRSAERASLTSTRSDVCDDRGRSTVGG
jgi:hypothetical protein